jgi:aryl-alcohol dehydrogenase-like predicted oxidoreductase
VAEQYKSKPASVAIAWLQARPSVTAPIASATNINQLDALIQASRLTLDAASLALLNKASEW